MLKHWLHAALVAALAVAVAHPANAAEKAKVLLLGQSPDGHPENTHEYLPGQKILAHLLSQVPDLDVQVVKADDPWTEGPELLETADAAVVFVSEGAKWVNADPRRHQAFTKLAARGGGLVCLHWGMGTKDAKNIAPFLRLFGGCHGGPDRKFKVVTTEFEVADPQDPITRGVENLRVHEEFYYKLKFVPLEGKLKPIIKAVIEDQPETVAWSWERPDGGRSFGFSGLHFHENWQHLQYRRLIAQAVLWSLGRDIPKGGLDVDIPQQLLQLK